MLLAMRLFSSHVVQARENVDGASDFGKKRSAKTTASAMG
jgi:hypothetical protein